MVENCQRMKDEVHEIQFMKDNLILSERNLILNQIPRKKNLKIKIPMIQSVHRICINQLLKEVNYAARNLARRCVGDWVLRRKAA